MASCDEKKDEGQAKILQSIEIPGISRPVVERDVKQADIWMVTLIIMVDKIAKSRGCEKTPLPGNFENITLGVKL